VNFTNPFTGNQPPIPVKYWNPLAVTGKAEIKSLDETHWREQVFSGFSVEIWLSPFENPCHWKNPTPFDDTHWELTL
jgi:hypothetical protein